VFEAYFDESGTHEDPRLFTYGGLVACSDSWADFSAAWDAAMAAGGAADKTLHMRNLLHNSKGSRDDEDYLGWNDAMRRDLLSRLVPVVTSHVLYAYSATIPVPDLDNLLRDGPLNDQIDPTVFTLHRCLDHIVREASPTADNPLGCIFQRAGDREPSIMRFMNILREERGWWDIIPSTPLFVPARGFPPIQAADMFAYCSRDHWLDQGAAGPARRFSDLLTSLRGAQFHAQKFPRELIERDRIEMDTLLAKMTDAEYAEAEQLGQRARLRVQQERNPYHGQPRPEKPRK
jgi:hypothetical protein